MAKKKAKWLDESSTPELLVMLKEILAEDEVDNAKAQKIVAELIERAPSEDVEVTVEGAIAGLQAAFETGLSLIQEAYSSEVEAMDEAEEVEEEVVEEKAKKSKKSKKKEAEVEAEEDEEDEESDYEDMSKKALKNLCREQGLKVTKSMQKADFIKLLEADAK